jgi:hypothetical protein
MSSVAQDDNRRPRGYGTALFGSEADASRAVQMFNGYVYARLVNCAPSDEQH